jgi:membrane-bound lytic murein transglycosylase D
MTAAKSEEKIAALTGLIRRWVVWFLLAGTTATASAAGLDRPAGLEPEIAFWRRVFTEVPSTGGLVHDERHLAIVYGSVDIPAGAGSSTRKKIYNKAFNHYRNILDRLAAGQRDGLTAEQSRVLKLFPEGTSKAEFRAAGERLRVQQGLADRFEQGVVRSGRWLPYIQQQLEKNGVPRQLAALPHVESSFDPTAYSHVGAAGLWQFTSGTGKLFMQVDHVVDQRRDPWFSSDAAAQLLASNYRKLESWPLAITAYNNGLGGMSRAAAKMGTKDIEQIIDKYKGPAFGFASRNFYVAFLAASDVEREPEKYFGKLQREPAEQRNILEMPAYVPVSQVANAYGITIEGLRQLNPALMPPVWSGNKYIPAGFELRVPARAAVDRQLAAVPDKFLYPEQVPDLTHKVKSGDTLWGIARRYDTSVKQLAAWNSLEKTNRLRIGQVLRLPVKNELASAACGRAC